MVSLNQRNKNSIYCWVDSFFFRASNQIFIYSITFSGSLWKKRVTKYQPEIFDLLVISPYRKKTPDSLSDSFPDQSHLQAELFNLAWIGILCV